MPQARPRRGRMSGGPAWDPLQSLSRTFREHLEGSLRATADAPMFFTFPEDARWNADRQAVEFGVEIGEYHGMVRVPRRVFQRLLAGRPTPEPCVGADYLQRTRFQRVPQRQLRRRLLPAHGNVSLT